MKRNNAWLGTLIFIVSFFQNCTEQNDNNIVSKYERLVQDKATELNNVVENCLACKSFPEGARIKIENRFRGDLNFAKSDSVDKPFIYFGFNDLGENTLDVSCSGLTREIMDDLDIQTVVISRGRRIIELIPKDSFSGSNNFVLTYILQSYQYDSIINNKADEWIVRLDDNWFLAKTRH